MSENEEETNKPLILKVGPRKAEEKTITHYAMGEVPPSEFNAKKKKT